MQKVQEKEGAICHLGKNALFLCIGSIMATRAVDALGKAAVTHPILIDSAYELLCEVRGQTKNWDSPNWIKSPAAYTKKVWKKKLGIDVPPMPKRK